MFYGNDFMDIARKRDSARSKPWLELSQDGLIEHPRRVGWLEILRDESYLVSVFTDRLHGREDYAMRFSQSGDLLKHLIKDPVGNLQDRGVDLWFVHHGLEPSDSPFDAQSVVERACDLVQNCTDLDPILEGHPGGLLRD